MPVRYEISATGRASRQLPAADASPDNEAPVDSVSDSEDSAGDSAAPKPDLPSRRRNSAVEAISKPAVRQPIPAIPAQPASPAMRKGQRLPSSKSGHEQDRVALIRAPRAETNLGRDRESRRYIRGVLHTHPWRLRLGAAFTLLLAIALPVAMVSAFLLMVSAVNPKEFAWVPWWLPAFPIALPLAAYGYLVWGMTGKCLVCKQKLFVRNGAVKHAKAHRVRALGFIVPLCLHMLAFHWFRCSSCGTPVRLRK
jgi:hypothetical protein